MKKEYQKPSVDVYELKMRGNLLIMSGDTDDVRRRCSLHRL